MTFTEKLKQLSKGKNKSRLSVKAGLPSTAISNYLSRKYVPVADTALSLARALEVPLEWLVDDSQDFPVPSTEKPSAAIMRDEEMMREICRRYRLEALRIRKHLDRLEKIDWVSAAKKINSVPSNADVGDDMKELAGLLSGVQTHVAWLQRFDPVKPWGLAESELPDPGVSASELTYHALQERTRKLRHEIPGVRQFDDALTRRLSVGGGWETLAEAEADRTSDLNMLRTGKKDDTREYLYPDNPSARLSRKRGTKPKK